MNCCSVIVMQRLSIIDYHERKVESGAQWCPAARGSATLRSITTHFEYRFLNLTAALFSERFLATQPCLQRPKRTYTGLFGIIEWAKFHSLGLRTPSGTVMVAITPILLGIQLLLSFLNFDINSTPKHAQYNQI